LQVKLTTIGTTGLKMDAGQPQLVPQPLLPKVGASKRNRMGANSKTNLWDIYEIHEGRHNEAGD